MKTKKTDSTVVMINYAGHDIADAYRFGKRVYPLSDGDVNIFETDRLNYKLFKKFDEAEFDAARDAVLISGSPVLTFIAGVRAAASAIDQGCDTLNVLIWDAKAKEYAARTIKISINKVEDFLNGQ